eukprot:TRINITY_DN6279_c0_g1_i1.p1 TRINITY_DN6279_c0_g1~~TRINITY_DN6279_c0_g1_i1.p1  ORF type:complete len:607 (-),score=182.58 TRINITY_DN6279_c0_g1_i1:31-1644(-)
MEEVDYFPLGLNSISMGDEFAKSKYVLMYRNKHEQSKMIMATKKLTEHIIKRSLVASSEDYQSQGIQNSIPQMDGIWSGSGFYDLNSFDTLLYELKSDEMDSISLVEEVIINSTYNPSYFPREVIIQVGMTETDFHYTSLPISIQSQPTAHISLYPFHALGRYVKIFLLGRKVVDVGNSYMAAFNDVSIRGINFLKLVDPLKYFLGTEVEKKKQLMDYVVNHHCTLTKIIYNYFLRNKDITYLQKSTLALLKENEELKPLTYHYKHEERTVSFIMNRYEEISELLNKNKYKFVNNQRLRQREPYGGEEPNNEVNLNKEWVYTDISNLMKHGELTIQSVPILSPEQISFYDGENSHKAKVFGSLQVAPIGRVFEEKITNFPSLSNFVNLRVLNLFGLGLTKMPEGTCSLTNLVHLNVTGNCFSSIDEDIGNLVNLKELLIGENIVGYKNSFLKHRLNTLPSSIGNCTKIEKLWLCYCGLNELPSSLSKLVEMRQFLFHGNPMINIDSSIISAWEKIIFLTAGEKTKYNSFYKDEKDDY